MTDNQALDAAIVAAGLDPRNPAVRQSWQAGIEKYLEVRNSEAVAWQYAIGGDEWDLAADATEATRRRDFGLDVRPLFLAPSAGVETVKVKPLEWEIEDDGCHRANSAIGPYIVWPGTGFSYDLTGPVKGRMGTHKRLEVAKAAASADYQQRVLEALSALVSHPPQSTPVVSQFMPDVKGNASLKAELLRLLMDMPKFDRGISWQLRNWNGTEEMTVYGATATGLKYVFDHTEELIAALSSPVTEKEKGR